MKITLSESEQAIVHYVARCREAANKAKGSHWVDESAGMTGLEIDQQGFGGELAVCKAFNVFPDFSLQCRSAARGDDLGDCMIQGLVVDVKTSRRPDSGLWVRSNKRGNADAYCLVTGTFPEFTIVGFAIKAFVFQRFHLKGSQYVINQSDLLTISQFNDYCSSL